MKQCDFYPEATSMTLAEYGIIDFKYLDSKGWQYTMEVAVRKKIFKITDADQGNVKIHLYDPVKGAAEEDISSLKAYSYNLVNGAVEKVKLTNKEYFKKRLNNYWVEMSFAIPNVQEGSVIEYTYVKTSDYLHNLTTWYFQSDIPVAHSEIRFTIPEYFNYQVSQVGTVFSAEDQTDTKRQAFTYKWQQRGVYGQTESGTGTFESNSKYRRLVINNIPPVEEEPYMNNKSDVINRLQFQLVSVKMPNSIMEVVAGSYDKFNSELWSSSDFGDRLKNGNFMKEMKDQLAGESAVNKAQSIYAYISNHFSWNEVYGYLSSKAGRMAYSKAEGSVADINLTLIAVLREFGLDAYPVILSTRGNGTVHPVYPSYDEFNYVIGAVRIDDNLYLCDASSKLPFGEIPIRCRNGRGWLVSENGGKWIDLKNNSRYTETVMLKTEISEDIITTHVAQNKKGYSALGTIGMIRKDNIENYSKGLENKFSDYELENFEISDLVAGKPVTLEYDISKDNEDSDIMYIQPVTVGSITSNPFTREERKSMVDLPYQESYRVISQITVPEGYDAQLPETMRIGLPNNGGHFIYSCSKNGNMITTSSNVAIKQTLFSPQEYPVLKRFYEIVVEKNQEFIVLSK